MNDSNDAGNGKRNGSDEDAAKAVKDALAQAAQTPNDRAGPPPTVRPGPDWSYANRRHPEDVPGQLEATAEELGNPIRLRRLYASLGKALHALPHEVAFGKNGKDGCLPKAATADADLRGGAATIQDKREGTPDRIDVVTVKPDVEEITADGEADLAQAERLRSQAKRLELAIAEQDEEIAQQRVRCDQADAGLAQVREAEAATAAAEQREREAREARERQEGNRPARGERKGRAAPEAREAAPPTPIRRPQFWKLVPAFAKRLLSPRNVLILGAVDLGVMTLTLHSAISDTLYSSIPGADYLLAAGVSLTVLVASATAGAALAAVRLPTRLVALVLFALFIAVMTQFFPALELLREGDEEGLVSLTAATALSAYVALVVAYATMLFHDADEERELTDEERAARQAQSQTVADERELAARAGTPLGDACDRRDREHELLAELVAQRAVLVTDLETLEARIEQLSDSAVRVPARVAARHGRSAAAAERLKICTETLKEQVAQEHASAANSIALADAAWWKANLERLDDDQVRTQALPAAGSPMPAAAAASKRGRLHELVAVGLLIVAGAIGFAVGEPLVFVVGAVAAIAVLLLRGLGRSRPTEVVDGVPAPQLPPDSVELAADSSLPTWTWLPQRMVPGFRRGDTGPAERP